MEAHFDLTAFLRLAERNAVVGLLLATSEDKDSAQKLAKVIDVFVAHGVRPTEAIEIMNQVCKIFQD